MLGAGDLIQAGVDGDAALSGDRDVLVGSGGLPGQSQYGVAVLEQALRGRVRHLLGEGVVRAGVVTGVDAGDHTIAELVRRGVEVLFAA